MFKGEREREKKEKHFRWKEKKEISYFDSSLSRSARNRL